MGKRARLPPSCPGLALVALALLALGGCVWLRLLALRDQFRDFDAHFIVQRPSGGLTLVCRHPVIRGADVSWVVTGPPSLTSPGPPEAWTWRFAKEPLAGEAGPLPGRELDMAVTLADGLVSSISFPDAVLQAVPPEVLVSMMRALGTAEIDRESRTAHATLAPAGDAAHIPDRTRLRALFGAPHELRPVAVTVPRTRTLMRDGIATTETVAEEVPGEEMLFRYRLVAPDGAQGDAQALVTVSFIFLPGSGRPREFRANLGGNWVTIALPR